MAVAVIVACSAVVGCSSDPQTQTDRAEAEQPATQAQQALSEPSEPSEQSETTTEAPAKPVDLSDEEVAQAEELLGWGTKPGLEELQSGAVTEIEMANLREEYIAECMRSEGFDYIALRQDFVVTIIDDPDIPRGTTEWIETYGFGTMTLLFPRDFVQPGGVGFDPTWLGAGPPDSEDNPNSSYYNALDPAGQEAFDTAIAGGDGFGGCQAEAFVAVPNRQELTRETLADELHDLDERVKASAEHAALASELDHCMEVPDYTFTGYDSMQEAIDRKLQLTGLFSAPNETELTRSSDDERPPGALPMGSPEWVEAIVAVQDLEILLATEFDRCIGIDQFFERYEGIAKPYRDDFLSSNHAVLLSLADG